jgi:hypothetical protein
LHIAEFPSNDDKYLDQVVEAISKYDRNGYENLIPIQASEVTVTKVVWVPMSSLCTDKWPKKTPRYD